MHRLWSIAIAIPCVLTMYLVLVGLLVSARVVVVVLSDWLN
jgi:hypothetical protein